jgi:5-methylcytosine-specific restriction protein A
MKFGFYIFLITVFLIFNTYHDGKYTNMIKLNIKYVKMAMYAFGGLSLYLFFKKNPSQSHNLLQHANDIIKYMPIDKNTTDVLAPFIDMTSKSVQFGGNSGSVYQQQQQQQQQIPKNINKVKRSVSETKKKYVASNQGWKCGHCSNQLDYSYEVDHIVDLQHGGSNETNNLVALCRNCHGKKTLKNYI